MKKRAKETRPSVAKLTPLGRELLEGLEAVRDDLRGKKRLPERTVQVPDAVDVKAIRKRLKMSQNVFADFFGFERAALKNWEQGRRTPERTARVLLIVIAHDPKTVREALAARSVVRGPRNRRRHAS